METKVCSSCKEVLSVENFNKYKTSSDGLNAWCRDCNKEYAKLYREKNKEAIKQVREDNKEKLLKYAKKYRKENAAKVALAGKLHRENNKEYHIKYKHEHYIKNKAASLECSKKYYKEHKNEILDYAKKYREENAEIVSNRKKLCYDKNTNYYKKISLEWSKANYDKTKIYWQRRRARKKLLESTFTPNQWIVVKQSFDNKCAYCGKELKLHQEHFIALSKGGEYTINNIIPSCQSCNSSKGDKNFFEWYPKYKYFNQTRQKVILKYLHYKNGIQQLALII